MTNDQIKAAIGACPKGANVIVEWERPVSLRAAYDGMPLTKRTKMLCRLGVAYDHKETTKEGRANGDLPAENAGLKGFEWQEYPILLRAVKTGLLYIRLEMGTFKNVKTVTKFLLDGQEVAKDDYIHAMLSSETAPRKFSGTFNCKVESITRIHEYREETEAEEA
jgi:hypothetical protein